MTIYKKIINSQTMYRLLQRGAQIYNRAQAKNPILIQSATSGIVASLGDLSMQKFEGKTWKTFDLARTGRMGLFRLALFGPGYSVWIRQLDKVFVKKNSFKTVASKIFCDQFIWAPPALGIFYIWTSILEGKTLRDGFNRVNTTLWPTLLVNWPFWGVVQGVTFGFVPIQYRVAWVSFVQIFWSAYLSGMNEKARNQEEQLLVRSSCE
jgi:protein Mpv17